MVRLRRPSLAGGHSRAVTPSARERQSTCRYSGAATPAARARSCRAACRDFRSSPRQRPAAVATASSGRLELADWLVHPDHPLTARVMANRIWQYHFGRGIVATPSNFGIRGEPPSHPELLDWLAAKFVSGGWSIKALHRKILLSETYQLSSERRFAERGQRPRQPVALRFPRRRLDAESIRDAMLSVSRPARPAAGPAPHPFPPIDDLALDPA